MGIQDRDYYKKLWNERTRYAEKARFRIPVFLPSDVDSAELPKKTVVGRPVRKWHPILSFLLTGFICLGLYAILRFISKLH